jgi:hypothetical protein
MLLSAILLFAAPVLPAAAAAPPRDACCAEAPCHDEGKAAPCPDACLLACHVLVAPEALVVGSVEVGASPIAPLTSLLPPGRALAPELPPPR